jgi:P27 family predicted phage terminase small subunit
MPDPSPDWSDRTIERWGSFWMSAVAQAVEVDSDLPAVERLFELYDERDRASAAYRKERMVEGSQGQLVMNPMGRMMQTLDKEIRNLEDRMGLNPKSRIALGIQINEARKGLNELMDGLTPDYGDSDGRETEVA